MARVLPPASPCKLTHSGFPFGERRTLLHDNNERYAQLLFSEFWCIISSEAGSLSVMFSGTHVLTGGRCVVLFVLLENSFTPIRV
jgi:hypothetical protein